MSERVTMPALGESVTEGTVTRWLKSVGDSVEVDEPLLEVSTDKVDTEIPSPVAGTLQEILAQEDDTVPVGADLAVIGEGAAASGGVESSDGQGQAAQGGQDQGAEGGQGQEDGSGAVREPAQPDPTMPSTEQPIAEETSEPEAGGEPAPRPNEPSQSAAGQPAPAGQSQTQTTSSGGSGDGGTKTGQTVTMPALGESVTEGTVTRWLKSEGDTVAADEALLEVSTDKVDTEIPSPVAGVVTKILVQEDDTVPVGGDLAIIGGDQPGGGSAGPSAEAGQATAEQADQSSAAPQPSAPAQPAPQEEAGQQAAEREEAASQVPPSPAPTQVEDRSRQQSLQEAPPQQVPQDATASASDPSSAAPQAEPASGASSTTTSASNGGTGDGTAYVTPLVRKLAAQHDVDLSTLTGTGIGGRIRKQDVLDAAAKAEQAQADQQRAETAPAAPASTTAPAPGAEVGAPTPSAAAASAPAPVAASPKRGTTEKMSRLRKVIAQRMVESLQVSAQLTTVIEVDLTKVARLRARAKTDFERREGVGLSYLPFLAVAAVEALKTYPNVNASVQGDEIVYHDQENLSIAVDTEKGLIVPVVKNAGDLNIAGLARAIADLADRTRNNKITPDDLAGGTFTITNTGSRGALFDTPIINQPQVAILGTGALVKRPVVVPDPDGVDTIAVRSMMYLALSYDHRIVDGADAARFLGAMKTRLEEGRFEASLGL